MITTYEVHNLITIIKFIKMRYETTIVLNNKIIILA